MKQTSVALGPGDVIDDVTGPLAHPRANQRASSNETEREGGREGGGRDYPTTKSINFRYADFGEKKKWKQKGENLFHFSSENFEKENWREREKWRGGGNPITENFVSLVIRFFFFFFLSPPPNLEIDKMNFIENLVLNRLVVNSE